MDQHDYIAAAYAHAVKTLLWSEIISFPEDENGEIDASVPAEWHDMDGKPFDDYFDDFSLTGESGLEVYGDVVDFVEANWDDVKDLDPSDVGHNLILSQNGHGTGFWDRGLGELGDRLHEAAKVYGTLGLMVTDDYRVHTHN